MARATAKQKRLFDKISSIGCIVCKNEFGVDSPAQIHHCRSKLGISQRNHNTVIPLCPRHHMIGAYGEAIHAGKKEWEKNFGTELELHEQVMNMICENLNG